MTPRLLLVEDDPSISTSLLRGLSEFELRVASTGAEARAQMGDAPELVVLDLGLPDTDGFVLLQEWALRYPTVPVIVLTSLTDVEVRVRSLEHGAVDWMSKPFWMDELKARIQLRLRQTGARRRLQWGQVTVDLDSEVLQVKGKTKRLAPQEWKLLEWLLANPNRTFTRQQLAEAALQGDSEPGLRAVDTYVARLRRKLSKPSDAAIETVWGLGYRFRPEAVC